jgi:hypothetical protein
MSQTLAQLVGNVSTGAVFAGIVTTASADIGYGAVGINSTGINAVGVITANGFIAGSTNLLTAIDEKASTGKSIAMAMVFG